MIRTLACVKCDNRVVHTFLALHSDIDVFHQGNPTEACS